MSIKIMAAVWELNLPPSQKLVLLALADNANDKGKCWPSVATLKAKCGLSDRTVQGAISALVDAKYLTRKQKPGEKVYYTVYPDKNPTPEESAPPKNLRPRRYCR